MTNCQVCGNTIFSYRDASFNRDGSQNNDYCRHCYHFGKFEQQSSVHKHNSVMKAVDNGNFGLMSLYPFSQTSNTLGNYEQQSIKHQRGKKDKSFISRHNHV